HSEKIIPYTVTDFEEPGLYYILEVRDLREGKQYSTKRLMAPGRKIRLFPTVASEQIIVLNPEKELDIQYRIIHNQGQQIMSGFLKPGENSIKIGSLAPGYYFLETHTGKEKESLRFI